MDGDDVQAKVEDTFRRVKIDEVVAKIMSVLSSRKTHSAEDFQDAVKYFSFVVDFYHDYAPTMQDIDNFAMMLVKKYDFNVTVLKASFLDFLVDGKKDEHGFPMIADDVETNSICSLLNTVYKLMDCMNEKFTINLVETDILDSLMKVMALPRSKNTVEVLKLMIFSGSKKHRPRPSDSKVSRLHFGNYLHGHKLLLGAIAENTRR